MEDDFCFYSTYDAIFPLVLCVFIFCVSALPWVTETENHGKIPL